MVLLLGGQRKGKLHDTDTIIVHLQVVLLVNGHVIFLVDGHMIRNFFGYLLREELPSVNVNNKISMTGFFPKLTKFISQPSPVLDKQRSSFASQLIDPISIFTSTRYLRLKIAFPLIKTNLNEKPIHLRRNFSWKSSHTSHSQREDDLQNVREENNKDSIK